MISSTLASAATEASFACFFTVVVVSFVSISLAGSITIKESLMIMRLDHANCNWI
jgi:hypothetical protein